MMMKNYLKNDDKNDSQVKSHQLELITSSIKNNYCDQKNHYSQHQYEKIIDDHLVKRLNYNRQKIIPWLNSVTTLKNKKILEVGCGTGSSTVALAEQGGKITAIDLDKGALKVAKKKMEVYGLSVKFITGNAKDLSRLVENKKFDLIIFFASLEHMTLEERLSSLTQAWSLIKKSGFLAVIESPNRLWYRDTHSTNMPFLHWLPLELAVKYIKEFYQENLNKNLINNIDRLDQNSLLRQGRALSYHEFELAIKPLNKLEVVSSLETFNWKLVKKILAPLLPDYFYKRKLRKQHPQLPAAFLESYLNLIIKKN